MTISKDTAAKIAYAYAEIEAATELLSVIVEGQRNRGLPDFRDAFGRQRNLQLGVPSGQNGHRLMDVAPDLAKIIIEAHVGNKRAEIAALCEVAKIELDEVSP